MSKILFIALVKEIKFQKDSRMSGLQKFIGSRNGGAELLGHTGQDSSQVAAKKERLQAKLQEMGFTDVERGETLINSAREPTQTVNLRRKMIAEQHRLKVPINFLNREDTSSIGLQGMGQSCESSSASITAAQGLLEKKQEAPYDVFDTDADSLEVTATFSDLPDVRGHEDSLRGARHFENALDRVGGKKNDDRQIALPIVETRERRISQLSDLSNPNDLIEDQEESEDEGSRDEGSAGEQPEYDGKDEDQMVGGLLIQGATTYFRSRPTQFPKVGEGIMKAAVTLPSTSPKLCQGPAHRYSSEPSRKDDITVAPNDVGESAFNARLYQRVQSGQLQFLEASQKQDQVLSHGSNGYDRARNRSLLRTGTSKQQSSNHSGLPEWETPVRQSSTVPAQFPERERQVTHTQFTNTMNPTSARSIQTPVTTTIEKGNEPWKLPFVNGRKDLDSRNDRNESISQTGKRVPDLDYTPSQLSSMTYDRLSSESFDNDPHSPENNIPETLADAPLAQKLKYAFDLKRHEKQLLQRRQVFSSMTFAQYEECGNLLIDKLGEIMIRYRETRQQKRKVAKDFEDEVARREEYVRGKKEVVDGDFRRLRRAGEDVVRGKEDPS